MMNYSQLLPDMIFDSVSDQGLIPTGALLPLNSYENRVYEIGLEDHPPVVAKYYRPERWSVEAIHEEHEFVRAVIDAEIPAVPPMDLKNNFSGFRSIGKIGDFFYAFYPKFRGREHADLNDQDRQWLGRSLARLHNVGETMKLKNRLYLNPQTYGDASLEFILKQEFLPENLAQSLESHLLKSLELIRPFFERKLDNIVVHGDCHLGNVLWNQEGPHLVDFDDLLLAPAVQDVWMLFSGDADEVEVQREAFFEGYEMFREFDYDTLILTEPLRTLRMIHYAAWIGKRYHEPAFQRAFPYYQDQRYWEEFLLSIKEQISLLQEI